MAGKKSTNINVRVDPDIKAQAEKLYSQFGLTVTDAVNIFLHKSLMVGGIPFDLRAPEPNPTTLAAMAEVDKMVAKKQEKASQSMEDFLTEMGE